MRRALVLTALITVSLAACSSSAKSGSPTTTAGATTTTAAAASTAPTTGAYVSTVPDGRHSTYIDSVDLVNHMITIDPMQYLTGPAAVTAFKHDHPTAVEGPPNDYYIVNPTKDHVVLPLAATAKVELVIVNNVPHTTPVAVPQAKLATYSQLTRAPFWITTKSGTVTSVIEQFVP
jgi:hypothetical protein